MKTIVITGGRGFIGSNLIKFISKEYRIKVLTRGKNNTEDGIEFISTDYHDVNSVRKAIDGSDIVIHLAATLFARNKSEFIKENVISSRNIVEASNTSGIKKLIYLSSLAAGGPSKDLKNPKNEEMQDIPVSNYGLSKLLAEKEIEKLKCPYVILRPPIVYGPKDDGFSTIAEWVKKGIMISPSNKDSRFSFIFVNDLCKCIIKAVEDNSIKNDKFYVCEAQNYSWEEFVELMAESMKVKKPKIIKMPHTLLKLTAVSYEIISYFFKIKPVLNRDKVRESRAYHWIANPKKWEEKTGFNQWTTIYEGLKKTFSNLI
ncbi:MAG: NAD(P)-dependent oxidoreductase [Elusimicrobiota bacterium]